MYYHLIENMQTYTMSYSNGMITERQIQKRCAIHFVQSYPLIAMSSNIICQHNIFC